MRDDNYLYHLGLSLSANKLLRDPVLHEYFCLYIIQEGIRHQLQIHR